MEKVVSELISIEDIVEGNFFKIPDYQRGYSWEKDQLTDLIKDIDHISSINHRHYTGTIVITQNSKDNKFEVVDGQQRITTLIIILKLIFDSNPVKYASIKEKFIVRTDGEYVFETNAETNLYFKEVILGTNKSLTDDIKSLTNLKFAKQFFSNWLNENSDKIDDIYQTITSKLGFICFSPKNSREIGIMFEVINNRGKALSELEKIKNYFIYYATINSQNSLRNKINENWGYILRYLSNAYIISNDDENYFLRNCYIVYYSTNKSKSWYVYNALKELYQPEDKNEIEDKIKEIEGFIDFIQQAALYFAYLKNGDFFNTNYKNEYHAELAIELKKLRCHPVNASILPLYIASMTYVFDKPMEVIKLLRLIEIVNFRIYVLPNTKIARADSKQGDLFYWAHELYNDREWHSDEDADTYKTYKGRIIIGNIFDFVIMNLEDITSELCPEEVFIQSLTIDNDEAIDYYSWNGLRFFLASYEEYLNAKRKESWDIEKILITREDIRKDKGNDYLSREHIWAKENRSDDFPVDIKEKRRLGNFVILGLSSNIQLQAEDIEDKVNFLIENSSISTLQVNHLKKYCNTAIEIAGNLRARKTKTYYHYIAMSLIDQRENELINFALTRWKLPTERFNKFIKVDSFEAIQKGMNENYFLKEK